MTQRDLKPRTRGLYARLLERFLLPEFEDMALRDITPAVVRVWHAGLDRHRPTQRAHAYGLLRSILATAVADEILAANPCKIRGGGTTTRARRVEPPTLDQLATLVTHMPDRYQALVHLGAWCGLRFGEMAELRRADLDLTTGVVHIRRGVVRVDGQVSVGTPKSAAGIRDVAIPPHLIPVLGDHLAMHVAPGPDALAFPSVTDPDIQIHPNTLYRHWYKAREAAGRPDLRIHDLRHTGAVLAARTGATLAELMARIGHSTPQAALRYQHAAQGRDAHIAAQLSQLARGEPPSGPTPHP
ncbi:tyrosine-type recombinase/integrase [Ornithinimicrobium cryptoxanthini]|uniref:tyrosine-type recombinase/integrase n=1 Tax=Ornithinimicrobium cryptoxanthini TaxID=2934161 RepID=UPI0021188F0A|nr:site-specific integrase [Ornithinimicrobium cryptoxanthini]